MQLKSGDVVLGSGALVDGKVTIPTGAFGSAGTRTLTAAYAGDATTKAEQRQRRDRGRAEPPSTPSDVSPRAGRRSRPRSKADANRGRRTAAIRVRCSQGARRAPARCACGSASGRVGTGRFRIAAGAEGTIRVKLNRKGRRLLAQRKRANATLTITYRDGRTERVRLRLTR